MAPPARGARRGKAKPVGRSRPGLSLTAESPVRPLSSFFARQDADETKLRHHAENSPAELSSTKSSSSVSYKGKEKEIIERSSRQKDDLWVDELTPERKSEVAVHKKKAEQVEGWLREALDGSMSLRKYRRILVLSGPSGSGKSALIKALSHEDELKFDIVEWSEGRRQHMPNVSLWDQGRGTWRSNDDISRSSSSQQTRFSSFLSHTSLFPSLRLDAESEEQDGQSVRSAPLTCDDQKRPTEGRTRRVIVLDDLPNLHHEPTRLSFQTSLEFFLQAKIRDESGPLVLIMSDSTPRLAEWDVSNAAQGWKDRMENTLSVRNVLPEHVRNHPGLTHIAFNSVAATFMRKALSTILSVQRRLDPERVPTATSNQGKEMIDAIIDISNGDIRSAINALQLVLTCSSTGPKIDGVKRTADGKVKANAAYGSIDALVSAVAGRESSMALFHALGRILYNKREGDPTDDKEEDDGADRERREGEADEVNLSSGAQPRWIAKAMQSFLDVDDKGNEGLELPAHLAHLNRRKSRVDVDKLWRSMPMDVTTLQIFLHQNYTPFCADLEQCEQLIDCLSYADTLKPMHEEWYHANLTQYYAFLVATHGTLMSLPSPVPRHKEQRFRGMVYFDALKRARNTHERISAVEANLRQLQDSAAEHRPTILAGLSPEKLACEVLPLLARCLRLPDALKECIEFSDFRRSDNGQSGAAFGGEAFAGADVDEMMTAAAEHPPNTHEAPLYDEEGKRLDVQLLDGNGVTTSTRPFDSLEGLSGRDVHDDEVTDDDEDEIEDID